MITKTKLLKISPIVVIISAVFTIAATVCVSFAMWSGSCSGTINVEGGNVGNYFVEYPCEFMNETDGLVFDENTYYMQHTDVRTSNVSYYTLELFATSDTSVKTQYALSVTLNLGDSVRFYCGKTQVTTVGIENNSSSSNDNYNCIVGSGGDFTVNAQNTYTLYYKIYTDNVTQGIWVGSQSSSVALSDPLYTFEESDVMTVRELYASSEKAEDEDGEYFTYHNYICVSRQNEVGSDDNSIGFLQFQIEGLDNCNLNDVEVKSISLERHETDENGNIVQGVYVDPPPRLYNSESVRHLSDIDHGDWVDPSADTENSSAYKIKHYDKGIYCILFFADNNKQYYALDIVIETYQSAEFKLTVQATNINHWQRYLSGYGEPWGFYLGGLVNNVWLWDPRRTTKMTAAAPMGTPMIDSNGNVATDESGNIVSVYNDGNDVVYRYDEYGFITGHNDNGAIYAKYIDVTLTVNLTEGSLVKLYMLDDVGLRYSEDGTTQTIYVVPQHIIAPDDLFKDADGNTLSYYNLGSVDSSSPGDLNLRMPISGEYTFRYVGKITQRSENTYNFINILTGEFDGAHSHTDEAYWYNIPEFNVTVDTLYISCGQSSSEHTVTFDANGGTFANGSTIVTQTVKFAGQAVAPVPPTSGEPFRGWYTAPEGGVEYDFALSHVMEDITLYAQYGSIYTVTFNAGGGTFADGSTVLTKSVVSGNTVSFDGIEPTRHGYIHDGWTLNGADYDTSAAVKGNITLIAKWKEDDLYRFEVSQGWMNTWGGISDIAITYSSSGEPSSNRSDAISLNVPDSGNPYIYLPMGTTKIMVFFKQGEDSWRSYSYEIDTTDPNGAVYVMSGASYDGPSDGYKLCTITIGKQNT